MASGKLGNADLVATTNTTVYTVPIGKASTININCANRTSGGIRVRLAISTTEIPADSEFINYDVEVPANGILERTGLVVSAGENVVAYASLAGLSVRVHGFEE